ncbi:Hypothetical predicted protein [Lecanosticta acicola]|uniref:Uncharacterized protein n=1 Tax=Lecanosticta acicola TaxID=111012 RepID=A0AAI8Z6Y7_9PEZI|nr:Hypothetical predicted protein [Lecanosticta acicola]
MADTHRVNYMMRLAEGNFAPHLRPRVGSGFHDEELDYDESRISEYEDSENESHGLDARKTSAEPSILTRRGTLNNNETTSREVDPPRRPTRRSARARTREAKSPQVTAAKQKLFGMVDDDQDDEEPAPPNPKQEDEAQAPTLARIGTNSSMREVSAAEVGTSAQGKAKERARLSRQLEDIEIEERELELKKRKRDLQRRMMELDEE